MRAYHEFEDVQMSDAERTASVRELLLNPKFGGIWGIYHDAEPVGYLALCTGYSIEFGDQDAFIDELYIKPACRGLGVGSQALTLIKVEAAKIELSSQGASLVKMKEKGINIWELLTRYQFELDIKEYYFQIEQCLLDTIAQSGLEPEQIDIAIKTGGSSNIPCFAAMLESIFGPERVKTSDTFGSVTAGLAIRAYEG